MRDRVMEPWEERAWWQDWTAAWIAIGWHVSLVGDLADLLEERDRRMAAIEQRQTYLAQQLARKKDRG
jgi:hypothetical protein